MSDFVIPFFIALIMIIGLIRRVDIFSEFTEGAAENLKAAFDVLPALIALMTAIGMFKASGALEVISEAISPVTGFLGFPEECIPLAIIRPVSGSGALAVFESILNDVSPDSFAGRVASVIIGSTETTFYTIAVYYGITGVKKTRHAIASSLTADFTGFILSALTVRLLLGSY
ncbi:MAG: spore maturation protein [Oscillospiraceae bacterium]|jgi:spore maturation protein B|nr:spore maturation protein [Oscillospiraceae bacterium]